MNEYEAYTPSEEQVRVSYMGDRIAHDGLSGEEALAEWTAFLARVRRDAAQEALGALAEHSDSRDGDGVKGRLGGIIRIWRDAHYPEETP